MELGSRPLAVATAVVAVFLVGVISGVLLEYTETPWPTHVTSHPPRATPYPLRLFVLLATAASRLPPRLPLAKLARQPHTTSLRLAGAGEDRPAPALPLLLTSLKSPASPAAPPGSGDAIAAGSATHATAAAANHYDTDAPAIDLAQPASSTTVAGAARRSAHTPPPPPVRRPPRPSL
uniref:Uncharacterized protein n=1 Tax=Setaria viridis TaxID=4556 RepID=A0A4U6VSL0_SETVI|nr:hypothetical protein SEVIR_2G120300v2 [Setaria viridis]